MTAMMAFFLIMWLLNATDEKVRKGVSEYFNPIHLSAGSTDLKGLNSPNAAQVDSKGEKGYSDKVVPVERFNPLKLTQGHADTKVKSAVDGAGASSPPDGSPVPSQGTAPADAASAADGTGGGGGAGAALTKAEFDAREHKAFQDPYAILAKLAASVDGTGPTSADVVIGDSTAARHGWRRRRSRSLRSGLLAIGEGATGAHRRSWQGIVNGFGRLRRRARCGGRQYG